MLNALHDLSIWPLLSRYATLSPHRVTTTFLLFFSPWRTVETSRPRVSSLADPHGASTSRQVVSPRTGPPGCLGLAHGVALRAARALHSQPVALPRAGRSWHPERGKSSGRDLCVPGDAAWGLGPVTVPKRQCRDKKIYAGGCCSFGMDGSKRTLAFD